MHRKQGGWRRRWRETQGLGEIVGGIGALLLLVFVLTGAISAFRLWQTHQVLDQAAAIALRSEEQNGCWTSATSQAVATTLQHGGLNPDGVHITAYAANQANYGQGIAAGLSYTTSTDFLFGGLGQWTEHSEQAGSSFYVPAVAAAATGCATPNLGTVSTGAGVSVSASPSITLYVTSPEITGQTYQATGTFTVGGIPIGDNTVTLNDGSHTLGTGTTNGSGHFSVSLTAPAAGSYTYQVSSDGTHASRAVTVATLHLTLSLPASEQSGASYHATGTLTAGGAGVAGQLLTLQDGSRTLGTTTTNSAGAYSITFTAPSPGSYTDTVSGDGVVATQHATVQPNSPTVSAVYLSGNISQPDGGIVTVEGNDLPIINNRTGVLPGRGPSGYLFPNILWKASPTVGTRTNADGNELPLHPDWGVTIIQSTPTELQFTPGDAFTSSPQWWLYLLPNRKSITDSTAPIYGPVNS